MGDYDEFQKVTHYKNTRTPLFVIINKWYVKKYALHSQSKLFHTSSQILANEKGMKSLKKSLDRNEEFVICICTKVVHILFMWNMLPVAKIQKI